MAEQQQSSTEASGGDAFPPFDPHTFAPTIFWLVVTFGILYLLLARTALPRVEGILRMRASKIAEDLAAARKMRREAEEAAEAYERTLTEARMRSQTLANETRAKVKLEQEAKRAEINLELESRLRTAEVQIAETKAEAMSHVGRIATETATAIVEHFTGKPADPQAVASAIAETRV